MPNIMPTVLVIAVGGALGSLARAGLSLWIDHGTHSVFPFGTLVVNVTGSFCIGLVAGMVDSPLARQFLITGIMGGYTTFSSFSLQTCQLAQGHRTLLAGTYVLASVALCLVGTFIGLSIARLARAPR